MIDFLRESARKIDVSSDHSTIGGGGLDPEPIAQGDYDLIVVWQMEMIAKWFAKRARGRLVFVPMYDGARDLSPRFWAAFRRARRLCTSFCKSSKRRV